MNVDFYAPDLTKQPPRSPRSRLGGFALLPRMLDKGRADIAGTQGSYRYACPLDQLLLEFAGIDPATLRAQLATGQGDGEILEWIRANGQHKRTAWEIEQWSNWMGSRAPTDMEARGFFQELHKEAAPNRNDVGTWADLLDLDDYVSFGGKP